ncbi:holin [Ruminococcus bromii]|uniref:holin n=1 Tax=Ruminococcus bromii TaxID=40518 RepID=UPI0039F4E72A
MNKKKIKKWAVAALIRAAKTMAQTAAATLSVAVVMSDVNWIAVGSASLLAGVLSILTSVAGLPEVNESEE